MFYITRHALSQCVLELDELEPLIEALWVTCWNLDQFSKHNKTQFLRLSTNSWPIKSVFLSDTYNFKLVYVIFNLLRR